MPGADGAASPGTVVPSQLPPFSLQLDGEPEPAPLKPKETEAPGAMEPLQDLFLAVQWVPDGGDVGVPGGGDGRAGGEVPLDRPGTDGGGTGVLHRPLAFEAGAPVLRSWCRWRWRWSAAWAGLARPTRPARGSNSVANPAAALCLKRILRLLGGSRGRD